MKTIKDLKNIDGKTVFIRCDFNVPKDEDGNITDDRRIRGALPTIRYCLDRDCKVILASHYERPEPGVYEEKYSLATVVTRLKTLLKIASNISLAEDVVGVDAKSKAAALETGDVLVLENLRYEAGETQNDIEFAKELASMVDVYINDAFGACHRAHASIDAMARLFDGDHRAAGFLLSKEVNFFEKTLENPMRPFVAVIGGSKVSGKLEALRNLIEKVDKVIIGGGMAFTFLKAQGYEIGNSLVENDLLDEARTVMIKARKKGVKFYLPVDVVVTPEFSEHGISKYLPSQEIPKDWMGLDIGPASSRLFRQVLNDAQTIIWNGPMGVYEWDKFSKGSLKMSHDIADTHATTIVGGGDTADVAQKAGDVDEMTFVSTGGGASLNLIEGKVLPGIEALKS
ncbi:phosphoglycerate kinase [Sulfurovum sp. bin170]|uniref:phosphoglycerate kinase n=1 Tax=Sulfurovum sp. bin170 TaxID=2695268 RepID=UPI0013DEDF98|nr:phosphoglycerate kinase [Sulfurovum sp. bin170]NEW59961.1 phosphoglycerate kinase [Sulfurovum sp. bin170]